MLTNCCYCWCCYCCYYYCYCCCCCCYCSYYVQSSSIPTWSPCRYCLKWYQIASQRVNSIWWDAVLAPLRDFEVTATSGSVHLEKEHTGSSSGHEQAKSLNISDRAVIATRNSLEDMELETKALTEPLPTNQQV